MAYGVRSQKFLCCLPVRFGVFVLSFLAFLLFGLLAAATWDTIFDHKDYHYNTRERIFAIVFAVKESVFCLFAIVGFIGSIRRSLSMVESYTGLLGYALGVSIVVDIIQIIFTFTQNKQQFINDCINGSTDQNTINTCNHDTTAVRFVTLGLILVLFVLQVYQYIIFLRYVKQLREEGEAGMKMRTISLAEPYRESTEALHGPYPGKGAYYASV